MKISTLFKKNMAEMQENSAALTKEINAYLEGKTVITDEDMLHLRKLGAKHGKHIHQYKWE